MFEKLFKLQKYQSNIRTEVLAGITTFVAAMYIIIVNPAMVADSGMPFSAVLTGTVVLSAFCTIMMGLYANNPILIAPSMGLNAFFTYFVVVGMGVPVQVALGALFWAGVVFFILSIFNIRTKIVEAIPRPIRFAIAGGIGLFIALLGFVNAGFIVVKPPFIGLGEMNSISLIFIGGIILISALMVKNVKGAMMIGIITITLCCIPVGRWFGDASAVNHGLPTLVNWKGFYQAPDFSFFMQLDFLNSLKLAVWPVIFAVCFTDMFDSLSTFVGVAEAADLKDENGEPRNIKQSLIVDAVATGMAGVLGTTSGTAYIESASGVAQGGRTGLTAVVAGLLFIPFMFFSPLLSVVPSVATAPVLVIVGVFMMKPVMNIGWDKLDDAIPCFLAMILIPLTYSITQGIIWGLLTWTFIKLINGKYKELSITLFIIDVFAVLLLIFE
ncbi:MAG TPA: NCS2 family permease [Bacteroidales bacterium]|nr:NCS2 family permease [Bacteroidales bacterium]